MAFAASQDFWNARDAWFRARQAAQKKARTEGVLRPSQSLSSAASRWRPRLPATNQHGAGVVSPAFHAKVRELAEELAPSVTAAMDRGLSQLAFNAWRRWPVASGLSKSLLDIRYSVLGRNFVGQVVQEAPYWRYITTPQGQAFRVLLSNPGKQLAGDMARDAYRDMLARV